MISWSKIVFPFSTKTLCKTFLPLVLISLLYSKSSKLLPLTFNPSKFLTEFKWSLFFWIFSFFSNFTNSFWFKLYPGLTANSLWLGLLSTSRPHSGSLSVLTLTNNSLFPLKFWGLLRLMFHLNLPNFSSCNFSLLIPVNISLLYLNKSTLFISKSSSSLFIFLDINLDIFVNFLSFFCLALICLFW